LGVDGHVQVVQHVVQPEVQRLTTHGRMRRQVLRLGEHRCCYDVPCLCLIELGYNHP
jgi:hypothetical protein